MSLTNLAVCLSAECNLDQDWCVFFSSPRTAFFQGQRSRSHWSAEQWMEDLLLQSRLHFRHTNTRGFYTHTHLSSPHPNKTNYQRLRKHSSHTKLLEGLSRASKRCGQRNRESLKGQIETCGPKFSISALDHRSSASELGPNMGP